MKFGDDKSKAPASFFFSLGLGFTLSLFVSIQLPPPTSRIRLAAIDGAMAGMMLTELTDTMIFRLRFVIFIFMSSPQTETSTPDSDSISSLNRNAEWSFLWNRRRSSYSRRKIRFPNLVCPMTYFYCGIKGSYSGWFVRACGRFTFTRRLIVGSICSKSFGLIR
jgi:hypothetical protein